jgi:MFS family permease
LLRTLGVLLGLQNLLFAAQGAIFVLFAVSNDGLGLSDFGVGVLFTMGAIGGLVGSFIAARVERWIGRANVLRLCVLVGGFSLALPGLFPNVIVAGACGLATGTIMMWNVVTVSLRQRIIPDHLLGRVNSGYRLLGWGTMPIGSGLGGLIAEWFGVRTVFVAAGVGTLALLVPLFLIVTDRAIDESERGSDEGDDLGARPTVADGENGDARLLGEGRAPGIDPQHAVDLLD